MYNLLTPAGDSQPKKNLFHSDQSVAILLALFLMILDVITTIAGVTTGEITEGNPIMGEIIEMPIILLALKLLFFFWLIFLYNYFRGYERITVIPIYACIVIHFLAVVNNLYQLLTL